VTLQSIDRVSATAAERADLQDLRDIATRWPTLHMPLRPAAVQWPSGLVVQTKLYIPSSRIAFIMLRAAELFYCMGCGLRICNGWISGQWGARGADKDTSGPENTK
jgi:hypothetical protein